MRDADPLQLVMELLFACETPPVVEAVIDRHDDRFEIVGIGHRLVDPLERSPGVDKMHDEQNTDLPAARCAVFRRESGNLLNMG
jgi:hypothetical protein